MANLPSFLPSELMKILDYRLESILLGLRLLETHMSKQDDQVAQIVTDMNAQFSALGSAVANVAADEQNILKQLQDLQANAGELTPENLAKLQGLVTSVASQVQTVQALADSIPDPQTPPVEPPPVAPTA